MNIGRLRIIACAGLVALAAASIQQTSARQAGQEYTNNFKYNSGQSVQPVFEGWSRVADGSFNLHFGYLNRNWSQQLHVPIGVNNNIQPGGPDRGQPTYFYTRTQRNLFTVNVPRDWNRTRPVVWTVVANGKPETASGWLQAEWEIDPVGGAAQGGNTDEEFVKNKPPTVRIAPVTGAKVNNPVPLSVTVADDGLPVQRPRGKPAVGQETPPTLRGGTDAPTNVPEAAPPRNREAPAAGGEAAARPQGLSVSWIVWRGPDDVAFSPRFAGPKDGVAVTNARFTQPGEYVLRASATDGSKSTPATVSIRVSGVD
jgi:hypothetical protein